MDVALLLLLSLLIELSTGWLLKVAQKLLYARKENALFIII